MPAITIAETGPDWEPTDAIRYYARRRHGNLGFGPTERDALEDLLKKEAKQEVQKQNRHARRKEGVA